MSDDLLGVLASPTRRDVLARLRSESVGDEGLPVSEIVGDHPEAEQLRITLYHSDLPKLSEAGLVEWDREQDRISKGPQFETVEPIVEAVLEHRELIEAVSTPRLDWVS